jgi:hypothetical protein
MILIINNTKCVEREIWCLQFSEKCIKNNCTMLHLFDDLWLDKIIPKNNDRYRAIYGNLENKIDTLYWSVEISIHKNNDAENR